VYPSQRTHYDTDSFISEYNANFKTRQPKKQGVTAVLFRPPLDTQETKETKDDKCWFTLQAAVSERFDGQSYNRRLTLIPPTHVKDDLPWCHSLRTDRKEYTAESLSSLNVVIRDAQATVLCWIFRHGKSSLVLDPCNFSLPGVYQGEDPDITK